MTLARPRSVFITIGQQMGNVALTDAAKRLANAPDSTVATIRKMTNPVHNLIRVNMQAVLEAPKWSRRDPLLGCTT